MGQLAIVIAIDVPAVLKANSFEGNAYMIDSNKNGGSKNEGTDKLVTAVEGTQILNWLIIDVSLSLGASIVNIIGKAVDKGVMVPVQNGSPVLGDNPGLWWGATVDSNKEGTYSYILQIQMGDVTMDLPMHVKVSKAFSDV